jgi:phage major head subunit gpT-like protein
MAIYSSQFAEALIPGIYKFFDVGFSLRPSIRQTLFNTQTSERAWEEFVGVGGIDPTPFEQYKNQGQIGQLDFNKGYSTRFTHEEYPADMILERKFVDDDTYGIINTRAERAAAAFNQLQEQQAADVFNNAFDATNYAGADSQSLCDGAHPASPSDTGTTFNNSGTSALTKDAIKDTRIAMMAFTDDTGNKMGVIPDTLVVPPALEDTALEIVNSMRDPESGNNTYNPQNAGRWRVVPWHFLSDDDNWFMVDSVGMRMSLFWFDRVPFGIDRESMTRTQVQITYPLYARYSYGYTDWRWVYGHNVS